MKVMEKVPSFIHSFVRSIMRANIVSTLYRTRAMGAGILGFLLLFPYWGGVRHGSVKGS